MHGGTLTLVSIDVFIFAFQGKVREKVHSKQQFYKTSKTIVVVVDKMMTPNLITMEK